MINIGTTCPSPITHPHMDIFCEEPTLQAHLKSPWLAAYLAKRLGTTLSGPKTESDAVTLGDELLDRHTLLVGASGSGKSRLLEHLLGEQLRAGCSAVIIDPKPDTVSRLLERLQTLGLSPEQITLLIPGCAEVPGWNPLAGGTSPEQAVASLVTLLEKATTSWGPRMQDLLTNAALVIAGQGLSLFELLRFLVQDDYRDGLLKQTPRQLDPHTYHEVKAYFEAEFARWSRSERIQAVGPITNKLREFLRGSFLRSLCCGRHNPLRLERLWNEQHIVLVHLDEAVLGRESTRLLAGMLIHTLFLMAMRTQGPRRVILGLDEVSSLERYVGDALIDIVTMARSRGLRLMVACQHLSQLSDGLSAALLANTAVQVFFRLGPSDSRLVGSSLALTSEPFVNRLSLAVDTRSRAEVPLARWSHRLYDSYGRPLRASPLAWQTLVLQTQGAHPVEVLGTIAARRGTGRLYVRAADTGRPVALCRYFSGLAAESLRLGGPAPLSINVYFPRPKVTSVERTSEAELGREWARVLLGLPVQHCVIRLSGRAPQVVRVVEVNGAASCGSVSGFVQQAVRANCQSPEEITQSLSWRIQEVARLAGHSKPEDTEDGSLA